MTSLYGTIALIALIDSINPNAVAVQVYLLSTPQPVVRSLAFILGDFTAAMIAGLILAFGIAQIFVSLFGQIGDGLLILQFILGMVLLWAGLNIRRLMQQPQTKQPRSLKPIQTFWFGLTMALIEAPTALPFLAAIERITRANLSVLETIAAITLYCVVFVLPLVILLAAYIFLRDRASSFIQASQRTISNWFPKIFKVVLILLGIVLILDSALHLAGYSLF
jgi:cytochrome c biogenesis protein CcdA